MTAFGKMAVLLTSKARQAYAAEVCAGLAQTLNMNRMKIKTDLGVVPKGYILVTDTHSSKSDSKPHFTVDAYGSDDNGVDEPIGCIHVYENGTVLAFMQPRKKAEDAYKNIIGSS